MSAPSGFPAAAFPVVPVVPDDEPVGSGLPGEVLRSTSKADAATIAALIQLSTALADFEAQWEAGNATEELRTAVLKAVLASSSAHAEMEKKVGATIAEVLQLNTAFTFFVTQLAGNATEELRTAAVLAATARAEMKEEVLATIDESIQLNTALADFAVRLGAVNASEELRMAAAAKAILASSIARAEQWQRWSTNTPLEYFVAELESGNATEEVWTAAAEAIIIPAVVPQVGCIPTTGWH